MASAQRFSFANCSERIRSAIQLSGARSRTRARARPEPRLRQEHEKELTIQGKHKVDFVSWWLEPSTGTIMCLAETDDSKGAVASHQETDGDLAEEMAGVTQGP
jgi:hypothetical protein